MCCCCSCSFLTLPTPPNKSQSSPPPCPTFHTHKHASICSAPSPACPSDSSLAQTTFFETYRGPKASNPAWCRSTARCCRQDPCPPTTRPGSSFFFLPNPILSPDTHSSVCCLSPRPVCWYMPARPPTHRHGPQISLDTCCGIFAPGLGPLPTRTTRIAHHSCC